VVSSLRAGALALLIPLAAGCGDAERGGDPEAWAVIERVRDVHGSPALDAATVRFDFRGDTFTAERSQGRFRYTRTHADTAGVALVDVLTPEGITRERAGELVGLSGPEARAAETTLNSVVYFALLPYNLTDPAVQPRYLGVDTVRGAAYDLVEVLFAEEGGGRDWEDRFLYWVHPERGTLDFLAYRFHTGEGGTRFREATNPRTVGGVRFADYLNYTADPDLARLEDYPLLLEEGRLRLFSEIVLDGVTVVGASDEVFP